jgi:hypothetical protein
MIYRIISFFNIQYKNEWTHLDCGVELLRFSVDYHRLKKESILELYTVLCKLSGTNNVDSSFTILKKYQHIDFFYDNGGYFLNILLLHKKIPPAYVYKLDRYYQTRYYRTKEHYVEIFKEDSLRKIKRQSEGQKLEKELKRLGKKE